MNRVTNENGKSVIAVGEAKSPARMRSVYPDTIEALLSAVAKAGYTKATEAGNCFLMEIISEKFYHLHTDEVDVIKAVWFYHEHENRF